MRANAIAIDEHVSYIKPFTVDGFFREKWSPEPQSKDLNGIETCVVKGLGKLPTKSNPFRGLASYILYVIYIPYGNQID